MNKASAAEEAASGSGRFKLSKRLEYLHSVLQV
jgi:hypothetical protein